MVERIYSCQNLHQIQSELAHEKLNSENSKGSVEWSLNMLAANNTAIVRTEYLIKFFENTIVPPSLGFIIYYLYQFKNCFTLMNSKLLVYLFL